MQITNTVLMIRPASFGFNAETAANNFFQHDSGKSAHVLQQSALEQFDKMVELLRSNGVNVIVEEDLAEPACPDAIFPNNWFTASNNRLSIFPMFAQSRRAEKRDDILKRLTEKYMVEDVNDWSEFEAEAMYLEGTGSMVMDHRHRIIYACLSPRTHPAVVEKFAAANGYRALTFSANDLEGRPIYHTNVMMCIGEGFAVFCPKAITDHIERIAVAQLLETTGHENIYITPDQLGAFAGNMLQLLNDKGEKLIVLSQAAFDVLSDEQKLQLENHGRLLPIDVSVIEQVEGGSVRCMMAEIFLEPR